MKNPRLRTILATGIAAVLFTTAGMPAHAQLTVFDPTNFSQNVLTAARELQQVNNQIHSLQNEATSLINQATSLINEARNLASLPYSSLAQLEQSITQTQQLPLDGEEPLDLGHGLQKELALFVQFIGFD